MHNYSAFYTICQDVATIWRRDITRSAVWRTSASYIILIWRNCKHDYKCLSKERWPFWRADACIGDDAGTAVSSIAAPSSAAPSHLVNACDLMIRSPFASHVSWICFLSKLDHCYHYRIGTLRFQCLIASFHWPFPSFCSVHETRGKNNIWTSLQNDWKC